MHIFHFLWLTAVFLSLLASAQAVPAPITITVQSVNFNYNKDKVRGVNLGGWLVLEPWITPSIFEEWSTSMLVRDEYAFTKTLGRAEASSRLQRHWDTWITQGDFNQIAQAGLNHVRIPIGYWAVAPVAGDPYVQGQLPILDKAIVWARQVGLRVMIDLHGAPGSQNGFDNSGRWGDVHWQEGDTIGQTLAAIKGLSERYAASADVVTAIELVNEPNPYREANTKMSQDFLDKIKPFYEAGYNQFRAASYDSVVVIHDAFQELAYWQGFMGYKTKFHHVMLDTHRYQIFTDAQVALNPTQHIEFVCALGVDISNMDKWTVVGEWTGAQTDCAKWLNGLGIGARYDGTFPGSSWHGSCDGKYIGTVAGLSADDKYNIRRLIEAQLDTYEKRTGWIFWTWKTESAPEWHMKDLLANGLFPQPLESRTYPGQCG